MSRRFAIALVLLAGVSCRKPAPSEDAGEADAGELDAGEPDAGSSAFSPYDLQWSAPFAPGICAQGWCWRSPLPQGESLQAVWAASPTEAWFAGKHGTIIRWSSGAWAAVESGTRNAITGLRALSPGSPELLAFGRAATALHFDGGAWSPIGFPFMGDLTLAGGLGPPLVYNNASNAWFFDGGTWSACDTGAACPYKPGFNLAGAWSNSLADTWAVGEYGGDRFKGPSAFHHGDAGWSLVANEDPEGSFSGVYAANAGAAWLFGSNGVYFWNGALTRVIPEPHRAGWGTGPNDVWATGFGGLRHWNGTAWDAPRPLCPEVFGGTAGNDVWAVSGSTIFHFDGQSWSTVSSGAFAEGVSGANGPDGLVFVGGDVVGRQTASGLETAKLHEAPRAFWFLPNELVAVGSSTAFVVRLDTGKVEPIPPPPAPVIWLWASSTEDVWGVGPGKDAYRWNGSSWETFSDILCAPNSPSGAPEFVATRVWGTGPTDVFVNGNFGSVAHFDGSAWSCTPKASAGGDTVFAGQPGNVWLASSNVAARWNGASWIRYENLPLLYAIDARASDDVWAVGGDVVMHFDGGQWSQAANISRGSLQGVLALAPNDVWAVGQKNGVVVHFDGLTWSRRDAPTGEPLWQALKSGNQVWVTGSAGVLSRELP